MNVLQNFNLRILETFSWSSEGIWLNMKPPSCSSEAGGELVHEACWAGEDQCCVCAVGNWWKKDKIIQHWRQTQVSDPLLTVIWWQIPVLQHSWNRLLCMGKTCTNWWGCLLLSGTPMPIPGLERSLCAKNGLSSQGWWCSSQQFALYLTGHTMTFCSKYFHISLIYDHLPLLEGLCIYIPHTYALCICKASSEDPLGCWPFPLCKSLATL